MNGVTSELLGAFREDHARLGREFHELSRTLRGGGLQPAQRAARRLDEDAVARIAFEERVFYPRLRSLLGGGEVGRLLHDHRAGLEVVGRLCDPSLPGQVPEKERLRLLGLSEQMETDIAECGELFEALGRTPKDQQKDLHERLVHWRREAPTWRAYAASAEDRAPTARDRL